MNPLTTLSIIISMIFIGCDSTTQSSEPSKEYEETKESLESQEIRSPNSFLSVDGSYRKNLLGEWVIEGKIISSAKVATYKDVTIRINFYSKTNSYLGSDNQTVYEFIPPNDSKRFKIKSMGYQGAKQINWEIANASAE